MIHSSNKRTYYKRVLPSPPAIAFSSAEGRQIFVEALSYGTMVGFFKLIEQFVTQEEPQYCGLAALSMTLNALGIDPRRTWKGAWRWFSESMLDCCKSMEDVKREGITLSQAACLARCNGADVSVHRYGRFDGANFRRLLLEVCACEDQHMLVSYSRKAFKQSGDGHFSPIGGYNPARDLVLLLDVARFKYSPHWVRVDDLVEAMGLLDPATGRPRGFLLMSGRRPRESALFSLNLDLPDRAPYIIRDTGPEQQQKQPVRGGEHDSADSSTKCPPAPSGMECGGGLAERPGSQGSLNILTELEHPGAAAHRFISREASALVGRLLAAPAQMVTADGGEERDTEGHEEDDTEEGNIVGSNGGLAPASGDALVGSDVGVVPSMESLVGALVEAAPLESVCALLVRRPELSAVGEVRKGPCCGCCVEGTGAKGVPVRVAPWKKALARSTTAAVTSSVMVAPCNSSLRKGAGGESPTNVQQGLMAAAAASLEAAASSCCRPGAASSHAGEQSSCTTVAAEGQYKVATQPAPSPLLPPTRSDAAKSCIHDSGASSRCYTIIADGSAVTAAIEDDCPVPGPFAGAGCSNSSSASSASLSVPTNMSSLDSAWWQFRDGNSHAGCSSWNSIADDGSSSGEGVQNCCHGEPLEHHCVPPQVQALVADEIRFTNMFKLVDYWLRRKAGCTHVQEPDLNAFMQPVVSTAAAAPAEDTNPITKCDMAGLRSRTCTPSLGPPDAAAPAAAQASVLPPVAATSPSTATASGHGLHGGDWSSSSIRSPGTKCDCGDLGLPEMAAEKLSVALLMCVNSEGLLEEVLQQEKGRVLAAVSLSSQSTTAPTAPNAPMPRHCGRPRCRKCRRRAAAAGDRVAALELLRERWQQLMGMAPLGLFASSPVLEEEVAYLRLQLSGSGQLVQVSGAATGSAWP